MGVNEYVQQSLSEAKFDMKSGFMARDQVEASNAKMR
jgi:hypothetical protein